MIVLKKKNKMNQKEWSGDRFVAGQSLHLFREMPFCDEVRLLGSSYNVIAGLLALDGMEWNIIKNQPKAFL